MTSWQPNQAVIVIALEPLGIEPAIGLEPGPHIHLPGKSMAHTLFVKRSHGMGSVKIYKALDAVTISDEKAPAEAPIDA